jgi:hypothetical protein
MLPRHTQPEKDVQAMLNQLQIRFALATATAHQINAIGSLKRRAFVVKTFQ